MNGADLAFPVVGVLNEDNPDAKMGVYNPGMTKRELLAGIAMQGLLSCDVEFTTFSIHAADAVKAADALIEALSDHETTKPQQAG